jgi:hypothetical protein
MASSSGGLTLARQVRERFVDEATQLLNALPGRIIAALETPNLKKTMISKFDAMEAQAIFRQQSSAWLEAARRQWHGGSKASERPAGQTGLGLSSAGCGDPAGLALVGNAEMDRSVAAGRMVSAIRDKAGHELSSLGARMQRLEGSANLAPDNLFRPETLVQALLDAWVDCGLTRVQWELAQDAIHKHAAHGLCRAYEHANAFLTEHGITAETDLRARVRRAPDRGPVSGWLPGMGNTPGIQGTTPGSLQPTGPGALHRPPGSGAVVSGAGGLAYAPPGSTDRAQYEAVIYGSGPGAVGVITTGPAAVAIAEAVTGGWSGGAPVALAISPLGVLQQQRAQGVLGSLRRFVEQHGAILPARSMAQPISPVLALALAEPAGAPCPETGDLLGRGKDPVKQDRPVELDKAAEQVRDQAKELKDKAGHPGEKAAIEIVSLMFQAILIDERLPSTLRVWFGRLQVPVLRVALAEPEFFAAHDHPARLLIDRMGTCAMGLDDAKVDGGLLEQEVKRIVQMIEQYPETGKKIFQVMLEEFGKFLGDTLVQGKPARKFATLAQQIEQKDALAIRYTIDLRNMLNAVPVNEDVRQFLFRVWAEVLALSAVRRGAQNGETVRLKQAAVDLLWAVSPKTSRAERQQVMQYLPGLLETLRAGMQTLAMDAGEQDGHIRRLNQALAQAFNSLGKGITLAQMNELARALTGLEGVVSDDPAGDLLLDPSLLEQMLGVDSRNLCVIASGGTRPGADMLQWAGDLQPGQWFMLHQQGAGTRVQYIWRSARGQLHLFAAESGKSYLVQTRRLAAYLQAGLIGPVEDEALTIRATREALTRLGQEPELLLH